MTSVMTEQTFPLPTIDYESHPYYREIAQEVTPEQRAESVSHFYSLFAPMVAQQASYRRYVAEHERPEDNSPELDQLDRDGIVGLSISSTDMDAMRALIRPFEEQLVAQRATKHAGKRAVGAASLRVCETDKPSRESNFFLDLIAKYRVLELCHAHKGMPYKLKFVVLQHNTNEDGGLVRICSFDDGTRADSYYTHIDSPVDAMKVIIYVSPEVTAAGGAFRYYPGSYHRWTPLELAIRKANDKCGWEAVSRRESRRRFVALPPDLQKKANFGNDILDEELAARILAHERAYETADGNLLLFDPDGAHRGAIFKTEAERKILQLSLVPEVAFPKVGETSIARGLRQIGRRAVRS